MIHRDIKPANVMLPHSREPKLMDFGIARLEGSQLTMAGEVFGTPSFMSPEQALAEPLDARTDIFSLRTVLYQLLTGRKAFAGESVPQIINLVVRQDPAPPSHLVAALPPQVDYIVAYCLARTRDDRYSDGRELAEDIDDVLAGRPPRHARTWTLSSGVEGTVVAPAPAPRAKPAGRAFRRRSGMLRARQLHGPRPAVVASADGAGLRSPISSRRGSRINASVGTVSNAASRSSSRWKWCRESGWRVSSGGLRVTV